MVAVKSVTRDNGEHSVFWDGSQILDPGTEQSEYKVREVIYLSYWPEDEWINLPEDWADDWPSCLPR